MRRDPIVVVDPDRRWVREFERERDRLEEAFGTALVRPIEHIGSTSVPGLAAKPIVDMLAVAASIDGATARISAVEQLGWISAPEPLDAEERRLSLCFPSIERRTHHLHVLEARDPAWPAWLAFRDHLRDHPDLAAEYAELKRALAAAHGADPNEREAYRAGKVDFIAAITAAALHQR